MTLAGDRTGRPTASPASSTEASERGVRFAPWKRFSLRSMFALTTLCCLALGVWAAYVSPYRSQLQSLRVVQRLQGDSAQTPAEGPAWQRWLVTTLLGEGAFVNVTEADLSGRPVDDQALSSLAGLKRLEKLSLDHAPISDAGLEPLRSMLQLRSLSLRYTNVSDRGAALLATLPELEVLQLTGAPVTDGATSDLAGLSRLRELYVRWTKITATGAAGLAAALPRCAVHHHALTGR